MQRGFLFTGICKIEVHQFEIFELRVVSLSLSKAG